MTNENAVPNCNDPNILGYFLLHQIEICLRELLIETLAELDGPNWYKRHLTGNALGKYTEGRRYEKAAPWTTFVNHDPTCYLDFPDLRETIALAQNWKPAFQQIFLKKEWIVSDLSKLEPIRNKVAHNRRVTARDLAVQNDVGAALKSCLGEERFLELASRCSVIPNPVEILTEIAQELKRAQNAVEALEPVDELLIWEKVQQSVIGVQLEDDSRWMDVRMAFTAVAEYQSRRNVAHGYELRRWMKRIKFQCKVNNALTALAELRKEAG